MHYAGKQAFAAMFGAFLLAGCATQTSHGRQQQDTARNVILFVGDGMGVSTVTATRIYAGQKRGLDGEEYVLPFETFPHLALIKTYNTNQQVPDSAGTASAMHTGKKTRAGVIGVGPQTDRGNCSASKLTHLVSLGELARERGKAIGIVSTARLTHATPAAVYAHTPERGWESDSDIPAEQAAAGCTDIARQLVEFDFDTALGGGRRAFLGSANGGRRLDADADLLARWRSSTGGTVAGDLGELINADPDLPLLGLFDSSHLPYVDQPQTGQSPVLTVMTQAAISRLSRRRGGYYLLVEGGRIDHGHHEGKAELALSEAEEFARAVAKAVEMTNPEDTLILVTADHSHVFTISGYPTRGNPILGNVVGNDRNGNPQISPSLADDDQPYTTLGYANGPGAVTTPRPAPASPHDGSAARQQALVPLPWETHGGEDVPLYAKGPGAHRVGGVMEQNLIFNVIVAAFGWPEGRSLTASKHADRQESERKTRKCTSTALRPGPYVSGPYAWYDPFYGFRIRSAHYRRSWWYRWPGSPLIADYHPWHVWPSVHSGSRLTHRCPSPYDRLSLGCRHLPDTDCL